MRQRATADSPKKPEDSQPGASTWHHPGGKLVELGANRLKQDELLAIVIGSGIAGRPALAIANAVLDQYVGLYGIHRAATVEDLTRIPGLGRNKAARILAAVELGRRLYRSALKPNDAAEPTQSLFGPHEQVAEPEHRAEEPSDAHLIAEIIGSGIRGRPPQAIAEDLLAHFGSFRGLYGQDMGDFEKIRGLNSVKIVRIAAALEIAKRIAQAIS